MNCQSIKNKKAEIHTVIESAKPDIILGNESWLTPDIKNSEIFPDSFDAIRKDRASDAHGGVFIAFRRDLLCMLVHPITGVLNAFGAAKTQSLII